MPLAHSLYGYVTQEKTYSHRSAIIKEGEKNPWIFIILDGQCKVVKQTKEGIVTLATLKQGAILGEMALFEEETRTPTATVIADGQVRVGVLDSERLAHARAQLPPQVLNLVESLMVSLRKANVRASQVST